MILTSADAARRALKAFRRETAGLAATEFALILPLMIFLLFATIETASALTVQRRVNNAANTLADLIAQSEQVTPDAISAMYTGVERMIEPQPSDTLALVIVSVRHECDTADPPNCTPRVDWSVDNDDTTTGPPYAVDQEYVKLDDDQVYTEDASLVVVEMTYSYTPAIMKFMFENAISFSAVNTRWPRLVAMVDYCDPDIETCDD